MNLALHGFLLQVFLSILNLQHGSVLCSAGEPGYLDFDNLPETNFSCQGKVIGGYYADVEAGCQMFHVCTVGQKDEIMDIKFLCLNGTVFDQETRVCERVDEVDCSKSERFYNLNLELYGNNAVTLSLSDSEDDIDPLDSIDDHPQRTTSARPSITTTTTTTTSKPNKPSTTPASSTFSQPTGYPHHFQPQPPFPQVHTSQSKSLYDDKNGGYHHHYILSHNGEGSNNQQATSYQIFSNQGVSSTTVQPPQVHQIRFSSTASPQIIHNEPSTVSPLFHVTSSTIQTLLSNNGNSPALINPIFHNHGIASTTEQFTLHNNNPRETSEYRENVKHSIRPLEAVQSISEGKVSKLTISPVPTPSEPQRSVQTKTSQSSQQQRILGNFLPTPATDETTVRSFYPTLRSVSKPTQPSQSTSEQVTQHIHVLPPVPIPQLKPHQITINLPPPDIQRIVQNPSPLLPSQSRVIVTAKASVSDESGRPLNTTQLVTLPLPTIPASYDDYKEGDESFDPFYRDVPKIRNARRVAVSKTSLRVRRSVGQTKNSMVSFVYEGDRPKRQEVQVVDINDKGRDKKKKALENEPSDFQAIKESLMKFRDILFGGEFNEDTIRNVFEGSSLQAAEAGKVGGKVSLEDLDTKASKNFKAREYEDSEYDSDSKDSKGDDAEYSEDPSKLNTKESDAEEYVDLKGNKEEAEFTDSKEENSKEEESEEEESKEEESKEENSKEENSKEEDSKEENSKEENSKEDDSKEEDSKEEDSNEEDLKEEDSNEEDSNEKDLKKEDSNEEESKEKDLKKEDVKDDETKDVDADGVKHVEGKRVLDIVILDPNEYIKMKSSTQESLDSTTEEDPTTTDASILSTTDQTTQSTLADIELTKKKDSKDSEKSGDEIKGTKHSSKYSNVKLEEVNTSKRSKKVEDKKKEESNEESKTHKSKESTETKPNAKRKSSRIRSFSGKIASRKDPKSGEDEAQTEKPTEPTAEEKIVTTTPVVEFEIEQIDKHIFDEPESQTSKEVDTRAVGHQGYAKSLQDGKDQGVEKDIRKGYANEYETLNKQVESLVKDEKEHEQKHEEKHEKKDEEGHEDKHVEKTTVSSLNDGVDTEDEKPVEKSVKVKAKLSKKQKHYYKEESSTESVEDEYNTDASDKETNNSEETKDSEEFKDSEETPVVKTGSRRGKSMKFETSKEVITHRQDKSRKFSGDDEEKEYQEYSTIKGEEVTSREVSSEYHDSTESFYDSSHEIGTENDYKDSTTEPEEDSTSREDAVEGNDEDKPEDDQEDSTEGVLKYTDELPKEKKEELSDSKKSTDSVENSAHDYVDDNYEPDNYKEMEAAKEEKKKKIKDEVGKNEENSEDQVEVTTKSSDTEAEKDDEKKSKDSSGDHVQQTTSTTTTTTTTSTTTTTTTTTVKPTPPKLFKPISIRKSYTYTPPTTTPNPVVIKPRISLLNPKPAKPPRSYNELAPKPVIRKFTLSRKATTTLPTSTVTDEDSTETTEVPVMMTEVPVALTEAPVTTTEARSEENVLEVKLDQEKSSAKDPMQNDQPSVKNEGDQDSSPSEQKSPTNVEKEKGPSSTESFTPYPVTRLSNLASTIRETLKEIESTTDQTTTTKNYTLIELAIISTTVPPLATIPSEPDREEATTLAVVQQEVSTETTVKAHQDSTETSLAPEPSPETTTRTTTTETVLSSSKEPEDVVATTSRYLNRKIATPKRPDSFNCLEKEMYRFYGDTRDCRLFHYCSPGFTSRQVLDFRFVCEEGTAFDEHSQSCKHDVRNGLCPHRKW